MCIVTEEMVVLEHCNKKNPELFRTRPNLCDKFKFYRAFEAILISVDNFQFWSRVGIDNSASYFANALNGLIRALKSYPKNKDSFERSKLVTLVEHAHSKINIQFQKDKRK